MLRFALVTTATFFCTIASIAQDGPQNGRIKKVDAERGAITVTAAGKDHELVVTDRSRLMDGAGRPIESRLKDERLKEGTEVLFRGVERDGRLVLDGLRLGAGDGGRPRDGQAGEIRRAKIKSVDFEQMTITLSADGKDHELALSETETQVLGAAGNGLKEKLKDFKAGADVQFLAGSRDGKPVLRGIRLADAPTNRPGNRPTGPATRVSPDTSKFKPITELGDAEYQGFKGGLYPEGNKRPAAHEAAGRKLAEAVRPLDAVGKPSDEGRIVLLSIGMSNATQEFSAFKRIADRDAEKNPNLVIVDGAQGGMTAAVIRTADGGRGAQFWSTVDERLEAARVTREQVQAAWVKEADAGPTQPFPQHARVLQSELADIARLLQERFPNLKLVYLSSRTYGGYATTRLNPEPFAYETGFAVKWLIEQQISGEASLNFDRTKGEARSPWLSWGPYLWANGATPREDGFYYDESDFGGDGTHPSGAGQQKVAELMLKFFKSDTTTRPWFLAGRGAKSEADVGTDRPAPRVARSPTNDADGGDANRPTDAAEPALPPLLQLLDRDRDRRLSRQELDDAEVVLMRFDRDEDGLLDRDEIARATGRRRGGGGRPGEVITPAARGERHNSTLAVGDDAPDFTLPDPAGKREVTLSSFRGKRPVVLVFTSFT